jgi:hypothetical protein
VSAPALDDNPQARAVFEHAFGAPWRRGPIATALDVLEPDLKRYGAWQSPRLPAPASHGATETPLLWSRLLTLDELDRRWVVGIDKHAAYLGVLGGLELGIGNPEHDVWNRQDDPTLLGRIDGGRPGYWRVRCHFPPPDPCFPDPLDRDRARPRRLESFWITTPTLELAFEAQLDLEVLESWTWPMHRRVLRKFGERCLVARNRIREDACLLVRVDDNESVLEARTAYFEAQRALKHTYAPLLGGFLARLCDQKRDPRPPWYRPDWRHHIIAKARANLWRNLARFRSRGLEPIAVYNDAFYVATSDCTPAAVQRYGVPLDDSLGGFSIGVSRRLVEVVRDGRLSFPLMFGRQA